MTRRRGRLGNERGLALGMVFIFVVTGTLIAGYALRHGFEQTSLTFQLGGQRMASYYHAQAGSVNAYWRISVNYTADIGGGDFTNPNFNPPPYFIDLADDTVHTAQDPGVDVRVDIGAVDPVTRLRTIISTGLLQ